jgi:uncharacterized protein
MLTAAILAFLIGVTLGILGGGGSILMLPVLVYVLHVESKQAITVSLLVIGSTSAVSLFAHAKNVQWRTGLLFGIAGMVGSVLGSRASAAVSGRFLLLTFGAVMIAAALMMLRKAPDAPPKRGPPNMAAALTLGALVGVVSGLVGAGGGFLIVPTLVLVAGVEMRAAVATSLLVIAMQSLAGFVSHKESIPWGLATVLLGCSIVGSLLGSSFSHRLPQAQLKRAFGVLVFVMGVFMVIKQVRA